MSGNSNDQPLSDKTATVGSLSRRLARILEQDNDDAYEALAPLYDRYQAEALASCTAPNPAPNMATIVVKEAATLTPDGWATYLCELWEKYGGAQDGECPSSDPLFYCDLGCGSGQTVLAMAARGWRSIGIDRSEAMLNQAYANLAKAREGVEDAAPPFADAVFLCQDMTHFELGVKPALMTCLTDGVSHLLREDELRDFFAAIGRELRPGGLVALDFLTAEYFRQRETYYEIQSDYALFWDNDYEEERALNQAWLTLFCQEAITAVEGKPPADRAAGTGGGTGCENNRLYRRHDLCISERAWSLEILTAAAAAQGLDRIALAQPGGVAEAYGAAENERPYNTAARGVNREKGRAERQLLLLRRR